jgi:hypothetical protein
LFVPQFVDELIGLFSDLYALLFACFISMLFGGKGMHLDLMISLDYFGSEGIAIDRTLSGDRSHIRFWSYFCRERSIVHFWRSIAFIGRGIVFMFYPTRSIASYRAIDRMQGREQFIFSFLHDRSHPVLRSIASLLLAILST